MSLYFLFLCYGTFSALSSHVYKSIVKCLRPIKNYFHILIHTCAKIWFNKVLMTIPNSTLLSFDKIYSQKINIPDLLPIWKYISY